MNGPEACAEVAQSDAVTAPSPTGYPTWTMRVFFSPPFLASCMRKSNARTKGCFAIWSFLRGMGVHVRTEGGARAHDADRREADAERAPPGDAHQGFTAPG